VHARPKRMALVMVEDHDVDVGVGEERQRGGLCGDNKGLVHAAAKAKTRSYRRINPSTTAHTHVVDILNTGGASESPYLRPHHTLLATKACNHLYQTHVSTTSKVTGLHRSARCSLLLTSTPRASAVTTQLRFCRSEQQPLQTTCSSLQLDSISLRGQSARPHKELSQLRVQQSTTKT
jgi:hypothetical protein